MKRATEVWKTWPLPEPGTSLGGWQARRCAWCGVTEPLDKDHCHRTGLVRGLLCHRCNTTEGLSSAPSWAAWRAGDHPAAVLGHVEVYVSIYGLTGLHPTAALSYYTGDEREVWWETLPAAIADGMPWPTEAPWTEAAAARQKAEAVGLREAINRLGSFGGAA